MKTATAVIGAFITFLITMGVLFKTMHWPGAGPMIVLGASSLSLYVILVAAANITSYEKKGLIGFCNGVGAFGGMVLAVGLLFKIMHWPGAGPMIVISLPLVVIVSFVFMIGYLVMKEPIKLSPGTLFATICFGMLLYGTSIGGAPYSILINICDNAIKIEKNTELLNHQNHNTLLLNNTEANVKLFKSTSDLTNHIEKLKSELYAVTDGLPKEVADTISLYSINGKDNYDVPTHLMGIADPSNPIKVPGKEEYSAITLRKKIEEFNTFIKEMNSDIEVINTNEMIGYQGMESWEVGTFYHLPLAAVVLTLNQIQLEANVICNYVLTSKDNTSLKAENNEPEEEQ